MLGAGARFPDALSTAPNAYLRCSREALLFLEEGEHGGEQGWGGECSDREFESGIVGRGELTSPAPILPYAEPSIQRFSL